MKKVIKVLSISSLCLCVFLMLLTCVSAENVTGGVPCGCGQGETHNVVSWTLDSSGNLEISQNEKPSSCTNTWYQFAIGSDYPQWRAFVEEHGDSVKNVNVSKINKIQFNGASGYSLFCGMTNLETVRFAANQTIQRNWGSGIFEGCTSLKSVVFGDAAFEDGVVDLSGGKIANNFMQYCFKNCKSITKVILPSSITEISQEAFSGATQLSEVVCLGDVTTLGAGCFKQCESLKKITFTKNAFTTIDSTAFNSSHGWDLKLNFESGDVNVVPEGFPGTASCSYSGNTYIAGVSDSPSVYYGGDDLPNGFYRSIKHMEYRVRIEDYDGLRSIFVHNEDTVNGQYLLKEYGAFVMTADNLADLSVDWNGTETVFGGEVTSRVLWKDGNMVEGTKVLKVSDDEKDPEVENGVYFALSLVNYPDKNIDTDVYVAGYEVWVNSDGEYMVMVSDYGTTGDSQYRCISYYDVALGLYKTGKLNSASDLQGIAWNDMVTAGAVTLTAGTDYLNTLDTATDALTVSAPTDLEGNAFGSTFTLVNVPIVKKKVVESVLDLTEKTGLNYTILRDGDSYTLVYKLDEGKTGLTLPAITAYGSTPINHQFIGKKWYGQLWSASAPSGYTSVSAARPQPLLLSEQFRTGISAIVVDSGIAGAENDAFFRLGASEYVVSSDFKKLSGSPFLNAESLTTFGMAGRNIEIGTVDLSGLTAVGELGFSKETGVKFTTLKLPSADNVPATVTNRTNVLCTVAGKDTTDVYVPSNYDGAQLDAIKLDDASYRFFFQTSAGWTQMIWNGSKWVQVSSEEAAMVTVINHLFGNSVNTGRVIDDSKNWEIRIYGTDGKSDKSIGVTVGSSSFTAELEAALRYELLAAGGGGGSLGTVGRFTKRENFSYCTVANKAYIADYISIKSVDGTVTASLCKFNASSTYDSSSKTYNEITYTETPITLSETPANTALASNVTVSNNKSLYMEVIYATGAPKTEAVEFEVTKEFTQDTDANFNSVARNFTISEDGKTAYICTNNAWQQNSDNKGMGAWLLEIIDYDTDSPKVNRKVLLNSLGNCKELIEAGLLDADSHGPNCPGKNLQEMGRACTGVVENGDYIYAVERYTGAFDIEQRLTNLNAAGDTSRDDGVHGHGVSYLCVIRKSDFKIEKQILLKNNATSVEINKYDGMLYVMEMTRNWSVYDISTSSEPTLIHSFSQKGEFGGDDPEKVEAYSLGNDYIEYQRATFWTDGEGNNYLAMSAFSGGATIWDITDIKNRIPTREAHFNIKDFNNGIYGRHVFDVAASYPYLYITVGGTINYRFSAGNVYDGVIAIDVSDLSRVGVDKSVATAVGIPFEDEADRCNEGDPAPSRIIISGDVLMLNYSDKGVAFFRIGDDGIPVYDRCEVITNGVPQTMKINPATGGVVIINGEGHVNTPGMYEIQITK